MYNAYAVIVNDILCEATVANTAKESIEKYFEHLGYRSYTLEMWYKRMKEGADVKPITIQVHY